jgi:beta-phosphoglucomutase-like phosphatase (HAD superfamily)
LLDVDAVIILATRHHRSRRSHISLPPAAEVPPGECLFVDDFEENIAGAQAVGMQTLHFAPVDAAMAELRFVTRDK